MAVGHMITIEGCQGDDGHVEASLDNVACAIPANVVSAIWAHKYQKGRVKTPAKGK
jgi:hypothetical protein